MTKSRSVGRGGARKGSGYKSPVSEEEVAKISVTLDQGIAVKVNQYWKAAGYKTRSHFIQFCIKVILKEIN